MSARAYPFVDAFVTPGIPVGVLFETVGPNVTLKGRLAMTRRRLLHALLGTLLCLVTASAADAQDLAVATFAGGCFWCMEPPFDKLAGVVSTTSGYTGGQVANPTYEQVSAGKTGHAEAVEIEYDPARSRTRSCSKCSGATSIR